jgi:uncharacterized 2Fe-2S/4Fe-4S cluster protein (DUF4445 family)
LALTSVDFLEEIDSIRDRITYLELNVNQEFMNRFSAAKFLPHTNASLFPSVTGGFRSNRTEKRSLSATADRAAE